MKKMLILSLAAMTAISLCASAHAGWQLKYIRDSAASPFVGTAANAWMVNWVPGYPDFYMKKAAANGTLAENKSLPAGVAVTPLTCANFTPPAT